MIIGGNV